MHQKQNHLQYEKLLTAILAVLVTMTMAAQTEHKLNEMTVIASRTTNNAEGYTTNFRGANIAKGKPTADILGCCKSETKDNR